MSLSFHIASRRNTSSRAAGAPVPLMGSCTSCWTELLQFDAIAMTPSVLSTAPTAVIVHPAALIESLDVVVVEPVDDPHPLVVVPEQNELSMLLPIAPTA